MHDYGFVVALIFFGAVCVIQRHLIRQSGYLPKTLGILMTVAGPCYLTNSFSLILAPAFASTLVPASCCRRSSPSCRWPSGSW